MKKTLSAMIVVGMLISAVPSSYAENAPLYLNHKLDTMTINTEKLETLETTHMLSNAFSFLSKGVKTVGRTVKKAFCKSNKSNEFIAEKEAKATEYRRANRILRYNRQHGCPDDHNPCKRARKLCEEGIELCNATIASLDVAIARNKKILEIMEEYNKKYGISI